MHRNKAKSLCTDFYSDEEVHNMVHAMDITTFQKIISGNTRTKPKIIINPITKEMHRLVPSASGQRSCYQKIAIEPTDILYLEISSDYLDMFRKRPEPVLPEGIEMRTFRLQAKNSKEPKNGEISRKQLFTLMTAIGLDSRWWPLDDPYYASQKYFEPLSIHVMFKDNNPIGVTMWQPPKEGLSSAYTSFMGVIESERTVATSGFISKWTMKKLADSGLKRVVTTTSANDGLLNLTGAPQKGDWVRRGIKIIDVVKCHPKDLIGNPCIDHSDHYISHTDLNICPDYYTNDSNTLPRYQKDEVVRRLNQAFSGLAK